jgi:hypothetical protein
VQKKARPDTQAERADPPSPATDPSKGIDMRAPMTERVRARKLREWSREEVGNGGRSESGWQSSESRRDYNSGVARLVRVS